MKESVFYKNKAVAAAALAVVIFTGVCIGYFGKYHRFFEMTFISNTFAAFVALLGALMLTFAGRDIPHFLYLSSTVLLMVVVGVCVGFAPGATLGGPGVILHLINPVLTLVFYLTFCDARGAKKSVVATALIVPTAYYIFMIIFGRVTGGFIYPYFDPNRFNAPMLVFIGVGAIGLIVLGGLGIMRLNRRVWNKRETKAQKSNV